MAQEEEILGKAYDSRLMRRLLTYLRPYGWQVTVAIVSIIFKSIADVLGPYLVKVAVDRYLAPVKGTASGLWNWLSPDPMHGIAQISGIYFGLLLFSFVLEFLQTYFMQWTGQKVMFDLRSQIFRHLQRMHVAFYDKNPVGRLVTRVTTDVDALNEMFTSGVVSIFEDLFVLVGIVIIMLSMNWKLALITFAVLPLIVVATKIFRDKVRDSYRRIRIAIARINSYLQEHVSGMVVLQLFNRERKAYTRFSEINRGHMDAYKDAILAYAVYYPVVDFFSAIAIACVIWWGGQDVMRGIVSKSVSIVVRRLIACIVSPGRDGGFARCADRIHAICDEIFPSDHGLQREVQHSAVGDGRERAHFQIAGYSRRHRVARGHEETRRPRPHRVRPRVVRISRGCGRQRCSCGDGRLRPSRQRKARRNREW